MSGPLDGLLVIAIEQAIAAPYCTRLLADQGARVIKVERPDGGDFARGYDTRARGLSSHFVWTNRSKESVTLDLKSPDAIEALRKLLASADIFVQNLAPGAIDRLGIDLPGVLRENPRLVTCSISGYGSGGPDGNRKAYDLLIQAEAGFLSVTGTRDEPVKSGISIADICAGVTAYHSILSALLQRHRTGRGDHVEVSMLEAMAEWMGFPMYFAMDDAPPPRRTSARHATIYPYGPYDTSDGTVMFGVQNDREWAALARKVLGREEWASAPRFRGNTGRSGHHAEIEPAIRDSFAAMTTQEAVDRLETAGIATACVNDMKGLWNHPQLAARGRWQAFGSPAGPLPGLVPVSGQGWKPRMDPVPALGEHTRAVLEEFGLSPMAAPDMDEACH